jgi:spore maturation protein CgeB
MKILICGSFAPSALENFYHEGFIRMNLEVTKFDIHDSYYQEIKKSFVSKVINKLYPEVYYSPINKNLLSFISGKKFDAIIVFKGLVLYPETVEKLKSHCEVLTCYNPDHPFKFYSPGSGNSNIEKSISHYHLYLTYSKQISRSLKEQYKVDSAVVPFGYDDLFSGKPELVKGLPWVFIGAYDSERAEFLKQLKDYEISIYGDQKWKTRSGSEWIKNKYQGRSVHGKEYSDILYSSKGVFNLLRKQNIVEESHNMRTFEVPGAGGVLIANRTSEQSDFFEEDKEAIYFGSVDELKDKLDFYHTNQHLLNNIKIAAYDRSIKSGYGYSFRSRQLINEITERLKG